VVIPEKIIRQTLMKRLKHRQILPDILSRASRYWHRHGGVMSVHPSLSALRVWNPLLYDAKGGHIFLNAKDRNPQTALERLRIRFQSLQRCAFRSLLFFEQYPFYFFCMTLRADFSPDCNNRPVWVNKEGIALYTEKFPAKHRFRFP
jgi:hypothetical protein